MNLFKKLWNSPVAMTWMSYSTQTLNLFGILPLILKKFTPGDIVIWYIFSTIISLQFLADFGFRQTFSRVISYAYGGAKSIGVFGLENTDLIVNDQSQPNIPLLNSIVSTMKHIYKRLTLIIFLLLLTLGTWSIIRPLQNASNFNQSCIAWAIIVVISCASFYGKTYLTFLEGLYKIALVRRVETLTSLGSIITSIVVLIFSPSLLNLIIANQFWLLLVAFRDFYLCHNVDHKIYKSVSTVLPFNKEIFTRIWNSAWRSGISGLMSFGLTNLTGIVYAQVGNSADVASYLFAFKLIDQVRVVSMAPLYSKIPFLARLRVRNDQDGLIKTVKGGMLLSHLSFVCCFVLIGVFSEKLLALIHSNVGFVGQPMWILLGIAFFIHRYGAMHMQVYLSTNHIIAHIADGVSGTIYILTSLILIRFIGIYAVPIGMILGYLGFYSWYAAKYSYSSLRVKFWELEKYASFVPVFIMVIYIVSQLFFLKSH